MKINKYIEMMKKATCNDEAMGILRNIKKDISDKKEMLYVMRDTEKYYFSHLKEICTNEEYDSVKEFIGEYKSKVQS